MWFHLSVLDPDESRGEVCLIIANCSYHVTQIVYAIGSPLATDCMRSRSSTELWVTKDNYKIIVGLWNTIGLAAQEYNRSIVVIKFIVCKSHWCKSFNSERNRHWECNIVKEIWKGINAFIQRYSPLIVNQCREIFPRTRYTSRGDHCLLLKQQPFSKQNKFSLHRNNGPLTTRPEIGTAWIFVLLLQFLLCCICEVLNSILHV